MTVERARESSCPPSRKIINSVRPIPTSGSQSGWTGANGLSRAPSDSAPKIKVSTPKKPALSSVLFRQLFERPETRPSWLPSSVHSPAVIGSGINGTGGSSIGGKGGAAGSAGTYGAGAAAGTAGARLAWAVSGGGTKRNG